MTVEELIEELKKFPPDAEVEVYGDCGAGSYGGFDIELSYDGNCVIVGS